MMYVYVNKIVIFYLPHPGICNILNGGPRINAPFSYACNLFIRQQVKMTEFVSSMNYYSS